LVVLTFLSLLLSIVYLYACRLLSYDESCPHLGRIEFVEKLGNPGLPSEWEQILATSYDPRLKQGEDYYY
jgi:hypothetical protein